MKKRKTSCWDCSQKNGHPETGGVHQPWHCKPDICPERARHAEQVYGARFTSRYGQMTRDGVSIVMQIDGVDASSNYRQERCVCGLLLIWVPK